MAKLILNADLGGHTISRHIYGHFAEHLGRCIYEGLWVGRDSDIPNTRGLRSDVVEALRAIRIPNLRWPGGCFADEYHWADGIGPYDARPTMVNTHWGGVTENNHFGTHEFFDLCEQLGCEPYVCGNVGSGTVREMQQWVEYTTLDGRSPMADLRRAHGREKPWRIRFWGVGNENWGCGGHMRPEYYADEYRRYAAYCRNLSGNELYKVACGPNGPNYAWTEVLMREAGRFMHGLALHYYTVPQAGGRRGTATEFDEAGWFDTLRRGLVMDELVRRHSAIMDQHDPQKKIGLVVDEWGTWYDVEPGTNPRFLYQQNTLRDALVAGLTLNVFNAHCGRVSLACIAQTVNVLQAMVLTEGERMLTTPTYHVFGMYQAHHDATLVPAELDCGTYEFGGQAIPALSASASRDADGAVTVSVCNLDPHRRERLAVEVRGRTVGEVAGRVLTDEAMNAHNTFDQPRRIEPADFTGVRKTAGGFEADLPAKSVVVLTVRPGA